MNCAHCGGNLDVAEVRGLVLARYCPNCGPKRLEAAREAERQDALLEARISAGHRLAASGMPACLRGATLENVLDRDNADALRRSVNEGRCVSLTGAVGTGKSWSAAAWLREHAHRGASVAWLTSRFDGWDEVRRVARARAVVLDDADLIHPDAVTMVVDAVRSVHGAICITSNQAPSDLAVRLGERVVDRLRPVLSLSYHGKSLRGKPLEVPK